MENTLFTLELILFVMMDFLDLLLSHTIVIYQTYHHLGDCILLPQYHWDTIIFHQNATVSLFLFQFQSSFWLHSVNNFHFDNIFVLEVCPHGSLPNGRVQVQSHYDTVTNASSYSSITMTVFTYSCNDGYTLLGPCSRTCSASGILNGSSPRCEPTGEYFQ